MEQEGGAVSRDLGLLVAGRFRVEEVLGQGGIATVFRVRDESTGDSLALKRLLASHTGKRALLMSLFEREFYTLAQLAHPQIVKVYSYGVDADCAYYTMELLTGDDLSGRGKQPWRKACEILRDVASALAILHSRGFLHRDISARNVRCTSDGRAKLIDLGALTPIGMVARTVVGTPPFVPPEAVALQPLDARADLFALGALAYLTLTGQHAYFARSLDQLRASWLHSLPTPHERDPEIPASLSELVMELLRLDRMARPTSAAVVMERLCTIASLPLAERAEVTQAYLLTPTLVGRDPALDAVRECLLETWHARGSVLLVEGVSGSGRSRLLDAAVLEAQLLGATVLRVDASDAALGDYGVATGIAGQVLAHFPQLGPRVASPHRAILGALVEGLREPGEVLPFDARLFHLAMRDWLVALARVARVVIALDDFESADEPSAALIAAIAHKAARRSLCLLLAVDRDAAPSPALDVLRRSATVIFSEPLSFSDTEMLLRSVFGDAAHIVTVSGRIHALAQGMPREVMQLARHLVQTGAARYEAGSWALPAKLAVHDFPASTSDVMRARLSALSDDARELVEALALTDPAFVALEDYVALAAHGDQTRTFAALDSLLSAGVLAPVGDRHRFVERGLPTAIGERLSSERRRTLHARLACVAQDANQPMRLPFHLLESGQVARAMAVLLERRLHPRLEYSLSTLELLLRVIEQAESLELSLTRRLRLELWAIVLAAALGAFEPFRRHVARVLPLLMRSSGLSDWHELSDALPPQERLTQALGRAQKRYEAASELERGFDPLESVTQLARLCLYHVPMAGVAQDLELIEALPSLEPLEPLSPALFCMQRAIDGMRRFQEGRYGAARVLYLQVLERLSQPDRAGLDESLHMSMRLSVLYLVGLIESVQGQPVSAVGRVVELESQPGYRVNAWRVRKTVALMSGDLDAAREHERRAELMQLEDGQHELYAETSVRAEIIPYCISDDLIGLKECLARLERAAEVFPRWRSLRDIARSHYRRLQGDYQGALDAIEDTLAWAKPGRILDWIWVAATHVTALCALGRHVEAAQLGRAYLDTCEREQLVPSHRHLSAPVIEALLGAGHVREATELVEQHIAEAEAEGVQGLRLGLLYEARALAALATGDKPAFLSAAERCRNEYSLGRNAALTAKYDRLMQEARRVGVVAGPEVTARPPAQLPPSKLQGIADRLHECATAEERARYALRVLLEHTGARAGCICGMRAGDLQVLANVPDSFADSAVLSMLRGFWARQLRTERGTGSKMRRGQNTETERGSMEAERYLPVLLAARCDGEDTVVAVAGLQLGGSTCSMPDQATLQALASALLDRGDLDGVTRAM